MVLPLPMPTTRACGGKCSATAAWAASRFAFSMGESEAGSGKERVWRGGAEERLGDDVHVDHDLVADIA